MAAMSSKVKIKQDQFFLPFKEFSIAEQIILLSNKESVIIHSNDYGPGPGAESLLIRWNDFKNVLDRSFPGASLGFRTFDTQKVIIPVSLYICL